MPQKKEITPALLPEEQDQIQDLLTQYRQLADQLRQSSNQAQAEEVLATITRLSESAQLSLIKALGKERDRASADVLVGINAFSSSKELRKEARRSLIRLEAAHISPQWQPPIVQTPAVQLAVASPPRFWQGFVTQSREQGEVQLFLCWEQGYDYSEARAISFLLDFWHDGVKDLDVDTGTRRHITERLNQARNQFTEIRLVDCTLAEGKRLLEEALSINAWRGTQPHLDYTNQLPQINRLILQATDLGEDRGLTFITPELEDQEVVVNFIGAWSFGDFGLAYDLLTRESKMRDGLARDEWIEHHRAWHAEAHPTRMELGFVHEKTAQQSTLWLPSSAQNRSLPRKELEVGWSLELLDTPLSGTLSEMPMGTAINKDTGRHWFWTDYTLVREQGVWRIQQVSDTGLSLQGLPPAELQSRIKTYSEATEQTIQQLQQGRGDVQKHVEELSWRLAQMLHFYDALLVQLPLDYTVHEDAYNQAVLIGNPERICVYLERLVQRFGQQRGENLRRLGSTLAGLAYKYDQESLRPRQQHLLTRSEEILREAITIDENALSHILLAELLLSLRRLDEAETELLAATKLHPTSEEEASIEAGLGHIAMNRERIDAALPHYERVAQLNPRYPGIWFNIGFAHRLLGHFPEAEASYQRTIQIEPEDIRPYSELCAIYMNHTEPERAREIVQQGLHAHPNSAHLHALLSSVLYEMGDRRGAQRELEEAEGLEPDLEIVQNVRQHIHSAQKKS